MEKMVVLLINEKNSDKIKESVITTFSDRGVIFCEPLTRGKLTFNEMIDYAYVKDYVHTHEFTHVLISGVTVLNVFVCLYAYEKYKKISLLIHDAEKNQHQELTLE